MNLPSRLTYGSLLHYSPRGTGEVSIFSRDITYGLKNDRTLLLPKNSSNAKPVRIIPRVGVHVREHSRHHEFLKRYFSSTTVLVPVPRRAPLVGKDALWPTKLICESLVNAGMGSYVFPCIRRCTAVTRSATAGPGERPEPHQHFESCDIPRQDLDLLFEAPDEVTIVDDVVTRGSTFVGLYPLVKQAFPLANVRCFAVVRTARGEVEKLILPEEGTITYEDGFLNRT